MMKKLLFTIAILFAVTYGIAQSTTTSFEVGGIKVIFKTTQKKVINVRVYYRGGVTNYPAPKAGIEALALDATTQCGTEKYSTNAFRDTCDKYDILMYGTSTYDYGYVQVNCISEYFNNAWDLFTQAILNPVFEPGPVDLLKTRITQNVKAYYANPDNIFYELQMKNAFSGTPYAISPIGSEETISGISAADLKDYYKTLLNKNRMFIVVVGNITKEDLYEKILNAFNNVDAQPYTSPQLTTPEFSDNKLVSQQRDLKINYVGAVINAPEFSSQNYVPFRLAMSGVGGNLYSYLRSNTSLSYNPTTNTVALRMPFAMMRASTNNPQQVIMGMMGVLKTTQKNGYNEEWLQHIKNSYITDNYLNEQSASQVSNELGLAEILGNWHFADDLPQLVNMVTVEQLNAVINYYVKGLRWTYLGDKNAIDGFKLPAY